MIECSASQNHRTFVRPLRRINPLGLSAVPIVGPTRESDYSIGKLLPNTKCKIYLKSVDKRFKRCSVTCKVFTRSFRETFYGKDLLPLSLNIGIFNDEIFITSSIFKLTSSSSERIASVVTNLTDIRLSPLLNDELQS